MVFVYQVAFLAQVSYGILILSNLGLQEPDFLLSGRVHCKQKTLAHQYLNSRTLIRTSQLLLKLVVLLLQALKLISNIIHVLRRKYEPDHLETQELHLTVSALRRSVRTRFLSFSTLSCSAAIERMRDRSSLSAFSKSEIVRLALSSS